MRIVVLAEERLSLMMTMRAVAWMSSRSGSSVRGPVSAHREEPGRVTKSEDVLELAVLSCCRQLMML